MLIIKQKLSSIVNAAISQLNKELADEVTFEVVIEPTKNETHGDYTTNIALMTAKKLKDNPRQLAQEIIDNINEPGLISKIEIAGPGFINFYLAPEAYYRIIYDIKQHSNDYGKSSAGNNQKIHIEFVSANPTGPLHVGHGRHAAFGDCVANLLDHIGYDVYREYYVNDAGRQMQILALSVWLRYLQLNNIDIAVPQKAYQGDYVKDIANLLAQQEAKRLCADKTISLFVQKTKALDIEDNAEYGDSFVDAYIKISKEVLGDLDFKICLDLAINTVLGDIKEDLAEFGVHYNNWFSEGQMISEGAIDTTIAQLEAKNYLYNKEGAVWFKTKELGDEKDRVLIRSNGENTYFAPDIAYHLNKLERGSDTLIDILGSDHHGYIPRLRACLRAFGKSDEQFVSKLVQFVNLYRGETRVQMSTRSGSFITLRELRDEVGNDATRFFYIERKVDQIVDFDIDLAKSKSQENPVYYIQYAHARICSITRQLVEKGYSLEHGYLKTEQCITKLSVLTEPLELALLKHMSKYINFVESAALAYEPHRIVQYLKDLAHLFHKYYNAHAIIVEDAKLRNARICLILAVKQILFNSLSLLGLTSPEKM